jgi:hypothetical protein
MRVERVEPLVAGEAVPLAPIDVEPETAQPFRDLLQLGDVGRDEGWVRLAGRPERVLDPHMQLRGHRTVGEGPEPLG